MADLTITAANILPQTGAQIGYGKAGAAITQGQAIYIDPSTNTVKLANNSTSLTTATVGGIAINSALTGQQVAFVTSGPLAFGAILTAGHFYVASQNNGGITDITNLTTGWITAVLGYALTTSQMQVMLIPTGVTN